MHGKKAQKKCCSSKKSCKCKKFNWEEFLAIPDMNDPKNLLFGFVILLLLGTVAIYSYKLGKVSELPEHSRNMPVVREGIPSKYIMPDKDL